MTRRARGFSLIEMAFVLVIVTLLLGGLLVPFATQVEQKRIAETNKTLEEIKEALIGYALANANPGAPNLPCPDTDDNGTENVRADGACNHAEGNLPWVTLGVGAQDAWGNRFYYRVTDSFADRNLPTVTLVNPGFALTSIGDINVCSTSACATIIASSVPVVVVSYGKNGYGALSSNSTGPRNIAPAAANLDELANQPIVAPQPHTFVSRVLTLPGAGSTEFDDQVMWVSPNILFNRMVAAGRLPQ